MSIVLLVLVGLSTSTYRTIVARDPGFDPDGVLATTVELPSGINAEEAYVLLRTMSERLTATPGVTSSGAVNFLPLDGVGWSSSFDIVVPDAEMSDPDPGANMRPVLPGYFSAMRIPLVQGRAFEASDDASTTPVVIIDETVASRFWPTTSPIGQQVMVGGLSRDAATVIGIVGDVPHERLDQTDGGHVYFPLLQSAQRGITLVARTGGDPLTLAAPMREMLREVHPRMPVTSMSTLEAKIGDSLAASRLSLVVLLIFGTGSLLLAAVGVYGVLSYAVARRTREIGTRIALGEALTVVLRRVISGALRYWAVGVVIGAAGSFAAVAWLAGLVTELQTMTPSAYLMAPVGLGVVTVLAALIPARRATTVDPAIALRAE
jgi:putative ABC transport system permease protein